MESMEIESVENERENETLISYPLFSNTRSNMHSIPGLFVLFTII